MSAARTVAALLLVALALAACGKKPRMVDPPQGKAADTFPQIYPNPALEPKPDQPKPDQPKPEQSQSGQAMPGEVMPGWKFP